MERPKNKQELQLLIDSYLTTSPTADTITRGCVFAHYKVKSTTELSAYLKDVYGNAWSDSLSGAVRSSMSKLREQIKEKAKHLERETNGQTILNLFSEKFKLPISRKRPASEVCVPPTHETPIEPPTSYSFDHTTPKRPATDVENCDSPVLETPPATPTGPPTSTSHDFITPKRSCLNCFDLRQESSSLRKELNSTRSEAAKLQTKVNVKFKKEPRVLGQANKRLKAQLEKQQETHDQQFFELQFEFLELQEDFIELDTKYVEKVNRVEQLVEDVDHLNNQIAKLAKQKTEIRRYHSAVKRQSVLSSQLKAAKEEIKDLKAKLAYTENLVEQDKENTPIETIDGNQFDAKTRKCIMYCLSKNVSQQHTTSIVDFIIREMTGRTVAKLPKRTTIQNIARESSIISNIQTCHIMSQSDNVTIAWDATSKGGTHMNEVHVMTPYGSFVLDVSEVPGARAIDYVTNIREILADIATQYSECYDKNPDEVKKQIHDGKICPQYM